MLYSFMFASAIGLALIWLRQRNPSSNKLKLVFLQSARGFLLPFFLVGVFYSSLQFWLDWQTDRIPATTTVRELEDILERIRLEFLAPFNLSPWMRLGIVLALVALGMLVPTLERARFLRIFRVGSEAIGRIYFLVALLGSFTFFGSDLHGTIEARQVRLNDHIDSIGRAYAEVYSEAESLSSALLVREILDRPSFSELSRVEWGAWKAANESHHLLAEALRRQVLPKTELAALSSNLRFPSESDGKTVEEIGRASRARRAQSLRAIRDRGTWSQKGAELARAALDETRRRLGTTSNPRLHEILKATVELLYSSGSEEILSSLLSAFGLKTDLLLAQLFLDKTLHEPIQEILVDTAEKAFEASIHHPEALERLPSEVRERSASFGFSPDRLIEARSSAVGERSAFQKVGTQVAATAHATDVRTLEHWLDGIGNFGNPNLTTAASDLIVIARAASRASPEKALQLSALIPVLSSPSAGLKGLLAIEQALGREEFAQALDLASEDAIATDGVSRWGRYRRLAEQNWNLEGEVDVREAFLRSETETVDFNLPSEARVDAEMTAIVRDWMRWQKRMAAAYAASEHWSKPISPGAWEKAFFRYTQKNEGAAVVWAWVVKDFNTHLLEARFGRAIPEYGYTYYVEENGFLDRSEARNFFSRPTVKSLIGGFCSPG